MRIPRFYLPQPITPDSELTLPAELFRHAIQVLRMKTGSALVLFNGEGGEYTAEITTVTRRIAKVNILNFDPVNRESTLNVTLVQSIIKPDKMDFAIQKSVELGISTIQPVISQRSVVRPGRDKLDKKQSHWQAVAINACEQSGRTSVPDVLMPMSLEQWLYDNQDSDAVRILLMPGDHPRISELNPVKDSANTKFSVLIGPEGGFNTEEVQQCISSGVTTISMGPRILRAETAALAITTLLQQHYGDI
ncbi:MAG: 16S rRNA (uracil(1498)-N(3))-methyltransferase [Thiolinea sp.]